MSKQAKPLYEFGPFRLDAAECLLLRDGNTVALTPKALEMLLVLIERRGHLVEKEDLLKTLWPDSFVEEHNLANHISTLRKVLGEGLNGNTYIQTVPRRGYKFVAEVKELRNEDAEPEIEQSNRLSFIEGEISGQQEIRTATEATAIRQVKWWTNRNLIAQLLAICMALIGIVVAAFYLQTPSKLNSLNNVISIKSIAILPFANANADPNAEYLSDGITESLINSLSQLSQLKVIARTTAFRYKGKETDAQAIGRDLRVDAIITGRVTQQGDTFIVQVDLISTEDGSQVWGDKYTRRVSDIFAVQEQVAREMVEKLRLRLTGEERAVLAKRYTDNTEAYNEYLKGRLFWNKRTADAMKKAIEHFEQAVAHDPNYALAHAGLADCYVMLYQYGSFSNREDILRAKAAATKALQIDTKLAEAHTSLAFVLSNEHDYSGADREYKQAIELNPGYATAYHWYASTLLRSWRPDEALQMIKRAQELDPLSLIINTSLGQHYYLNRRYDEAIEQLRNTLEMDPTFIHAHTFLGAAYLKKGLYGDAIKEIERAKELSDNFSIQILEIVSYRGHIYALSGKRAEAQKILKDLIELRKRQHISAYHIALIYAGLGETDRACAWLETAYKEQELLLPRLNDPILDSLRSTPRFADLLLRMGISQ